MENVLDRREDLPAVPCLDGKAVGNFAKILNFVNFSEIVVAVERTLRMSCSRQRCGQLRVTREGSVLGS